MGLRFISYYAFLSGKNVVGDFSPKGKTSTILRQRFCACGTASLYY
jgi:hypothetical protein